ncbi:hypothetical protein Ddc_04560 [Ditylenchus destructor]|nr:hypothetical protein Ddc_04560 [Ditylenchus destructor]
MIKYSTVMVWRVIIMDQAPFQTALDLWQGNLPELSGHWPIAGKKERREPPAGDRESSLGVGKGMPVQSPIAEKKHTQMERPPQLFCWSLGLGLGNTATLQIAALGIASRVPRPASIAQREVSEFLLLGFGWACVGKYSPTRREETPAAADGMRRALNPLNHSQITATNPSGGTQSGERVMAAAVTDAAVASSRTLRPSVV